MDFLRCLVIGDVLAGEGAKLARAGCMTFLENDKRDNALDGDRIGNADNTRLQNRGMLVKRLLHLLRRDVGAGADDNFLLAPLEPDEAVVIAGAEVAGMKPAAAHGGAGCLRIVPVAGAE